jgi:hypothetical protein
MCVVLRGVGVSQQVYMSRSACIVVWNRPRKWGAERRCVVLSKGAAFFCYFVFRNRPFRRCIRWLELLKMHNLISPYEILTRYFIGQRNIWSRFYFQIETSCTPKSWKKVEGNPPKPPKNLPITYGIEKYYIMSIMSHHKIMETPYIWT